jgi:peptide-methionine (S)-S-oxide reductase
VGYAGGEKDNPTYRDLGSHAETIQIDYDPSVISYDELLDAYIQAHDPGARPWSQQYASIVFFHDEEQRQQAADLLERESAKIGQEVYTELVPFSEFYLAEDYHQKYRLQQSPDLLAAFRSIYPEEKDFVGSTVVARANAYIGGYGSLKALLTEIELMGLSQESAQELVDIVSRYGD